MEQTLRRVVVTGLGAITPVGNTVEEMWANLKAGVHGIASITLFDTTDYKTKIGAEVKNFDPRAYMDKTDVLRSDAYAQYGVAAACQAVEESGVIGTLPPERVAVYFGSGIGGIRTFHEEHNKLLARGPKRISPYFIPMLIGVGCGVPGIMASRTIENERDRKLTIMLTPFIPCNAKLPVFALFAAAFFPEESWVGEKGRCK